MLIGQRGMTASGAVVWACVCARSLPIIVGLGVGGDYCRREPVAPMKKQGAKEAGTLI